MVHRRPSLFRGAFASRISLLLVLALLPASLAFAQDQEPQGIVINQISASQFPLLEVNAQAVDAGVNPLGEIEAENWQAA
ncbi:MAG TPA: hypothetical protein VD886_06430, partial [Herpetosiphonaceae bacterium]|nr:hypothetical protein [Herpetosiphonaceae bacterium]